jgi:hypothetical protein
LIQSISPKDKSRCGTNHRSLREVQTCLALEIQSVNVIPTSLGLESQKRYGAMSFCLYIQYTSDSDKVHLHVEGLHVKGQFGIDNEFYQTYLARALYQLLCAFRSHLPVFLIVYKLLRFKPIYQLSACTRVFQDCHNHPKVLDSNCWKLERRIHRLNNGPQKLQYGC